MQNSENFQNSIVKICVKEYVMHHLLPCTYLEKEAEMSTKLHAYSAFCSRGIVTPAGAALMMQLGCDGVFVGVEISTVWIHISKLGQLWMQ